MSDAKTTVYTIAVYVTIAPDDGQLPSNRDVEREMSRILRSADTSWREFKTADYEVLEANPIESAERKIRS